MIMKSAYNSASEWNSEIQREKYSKWPNGVMLKVLFGGKDYLPRPYKPKKDWEALNAE